MDKGIKYFMSGCALYLCLQSLISFVGVLPRLIFLVADGLTIGYTAIRGIVMSELNCYDLPGRSSLGVKREDGQNISALK